jgi:hypothetical protein
MANFHVRDVEAKVTALSTALAHLGRGTTLADIIKLIHLPGYTTPVEFALTMTILDAMTAQVDALTKLQHELLTATKMIVKAG